MATSSTNSFLRSQRKSDLLDLADEVGLKDTDGKKKIELELALDNHLSANQIHSSNPRAAPFYQSRSRATGTPLRREVPVIESRTRRGTARLAEQAIDDDLELPARQATPSGSGRSLVRRAELPATPADIARVVDESTVAVRDRIATMYANTFTGELPYTARDALSTVNAIIFTISVFELYYLRQEILPNRYFFTIPGALGFSDYAVTFPDLTIIFQSSFWIPLLLWLATSVIIPAIIGFFCNLRAAHAAAGGRKRPTRTEDNIDPLIFSIAKAVITYVVYEQGTNLFGLISQDGVARINSAMCGGWKGVITGALISGVVSFYDAVLQN